MGMAVFMAIIYVHWSIWIKRSMNSCLNENQAEARNLDSTMNEIELNAIIVYDISKYFAVQPKNKTETKRWTVLTWWMSQVLIFIKCRTITTQSHYSQFSHIKSATRKCQWMFGCLCCVCREIAGWYWS